MEKLEAKNNMTKSDFFKKINIINTTNKVCYCIIFIISCGIFIERAVECFTKYFKGETSINVEIKR